MRVHAPVHVRGVQEREAHHVLEALGAPGHVGIGRLLLADEEPWVSPLVEPVHGVAVHCT